MSSLFLSVRAGLLTLVPNVVPIVVLFGVMGFAGIDLNISTSMIAAIALGIAIDDTIHYFNEFKLQIRETGDIEQAIIAVVSSVGRPIVFTAGALCAAFLILCLSSFQLIRQFGLLASFTMAIDPSRSDHAWSRSSHQDLLFDSARGHTRRFRSADRPLEARIVVLKRHVRGPERSRRRASSSPRCTCCWAARSTSSVTGPRASVVWDVATRSARWAWSASKRAPPWWWRASTVLG
jgi:hypothetical protein